MCNLCAMTNETKPLDWRSIETAPMGVEVWTRILDGDGERNVQKLTRRGNLWWTKDMYVYYQPTHWAP